MSYKFLKNENKILTWNHKPIREWVTSGGGPTEIMVFPTMTDYTTPSPYVVTYSSYRGIGSRYPWRPVSAKLNNTTWWQSRTGTPQWLKVYVGEENQTRIWKYHLGGPGVFPTSWTIEGSNDDSSYTMLDSQSGISSGWSNWTSRFFILPSVSDSFKYFRFTVSSFFGDSLFGLSSWNLYQYQ